MIFCDCKIEMWFLVKYLEISETCQHLWIKALRHSVKKIVLISLIYIFSISEDASMQHIKKHLTLVCPQKIKMLKFMSLDNLKYIITIIPNKYIIINKKINYYLYFTPKKFKICKKQHRFWLFCLLFICIETIEYQKILTQTINRI